MKLHQQFDLRLDVLKENSISTLKNIKEIPVLIGELTKDLIKKGYIVVVESTNYGGIPHSITVVKDFTGPFVVNLSSKVKNDFKAVTRSLGIESFFE